MVKETPGQRVVRLLGAKRLAAACDLTTNAVWKWDLIPAKHQSAVLRLARELDVELHPADLMQDAA